MKLLLLMVGLVLTAAAYSQGNIKTEIDKFTKEKRVQTEDVVINLTDEARLAVQLRSVGDSCFIIFVGYGHGPEIISPSSRAMILLGNDSTIQVTSTGLQSYERNYSTKSYRHQYSISKGQLQQMAGSPLKAVRRYGVDSYVDIDISEGNRQKLQELIKEFLKALE
jgi:hypothetical protein